MRAIVIAFALAASLGAEAKEFRRPHPGIPSPARLATLKGPEIYALGVPWCAATAAMIATVTLRRELRLREAWEIFGSCVLPIVGGFVVRALWRPEWDRIPLPPNRGVDFGIGSQS